MEPFSLHSILFIDQEKGWKWDSPEVFEAVAGYTHVLLTYIPSLRVLKEGDYEGTTGMRGYGLPGRFGDEGRGAHRRRRGRGDALLNRPFSPS